MPKVFLVTGSGIGLGRTLSESILSAGHRLVATALDPATLEDLVEAHRDRVLPLQLDVTDVERCYVIMQAGVDRFGGVDVVVNNAGFASMGSVEDMPLAAMQAMMATNFFGAINVTKAALPLMRERGRGHIFYVSSIAARTARPGAALYFASKRALSGFGECLAQEVGPLGIKVTVVEPNMMRTNFFSQTCFPSHPAYASTVGHLVDSKDKQGFLNRLGHPLKIVDAILKMAELESPPLRILVGNEAYERGTEADKARLLDDEKWQWLSAETEDWNR